MYEIDNDVPQPGNLIHETLMAMGVGQSIHVTEDKERTRIMTAAAKLEDGKFISRKVGDDDPKGAGFRVWRD